MLNKKQSILTAVVLGLFVTLGVPLFAQTTTTVPVSWGDGQVDGTRESASTSQFSPGRYAFDGNQNTVWQLSSGSTEGWVERYWPSAKRIAGVSLNLKIDAGSVLQLSYLSQNNWVPISGAVINGPQNGTVAITFPGELPPFSKVLLSLRGSDADRAKIGEVTFRTWDVPAPYGKILPKSYTFNQPEYINLKASRLWDGIIGNSWFQPLWNKPSEVFQTDAANSPNRIFPPFSENPPSNGEIIWELDGPYQIQKLKAYFVQDWRIVKFEFWNGSAWVNAQTIGESSNHDQNTPWQSIVLGSPVTTQRIRITFPQGWSKASYLGELEVWGSGFTDDQALALNIPPLASDSSYHFTLNSTEIKDYDVEVWVSGISADILSGQWNGTSFTANPSTWIGTDTVYRLRIDKESIRPDAQFLQLVTTKVLRGVVFKKPLERGLINLGWPYSDGQFENTVAGPASPVPQIKQQVWDLGNQYQLEKLRIFVKNAPVLDFKLRRIQDSNWIPVVWAAQGDGWWEANLQGIRADKLLLDSTVAVTIDEIQLFGSPLKDKKLALEIWWPNPAAPVTSADSDGNSIIGWKGTPGAQALIGEFNARNSDNLFWMPLNQLGMAPGEEKDFLVQGNSNGIGAQKRITIKWKGSSAIATLDQGTDLLSTSQTSLTLSGKVFDKNLRCFVNGVEVPISSADVFSTSIALVNGFQLATIEIWDKHKNKLKATLNKPIYRTVGQLLLRFDQPPGDLYSQSSSLLVSGLVGNGVGLGLTLNGAAVALTGNRFSQTVALAEGTNQFAFVLRDSSGRETQQVLTVHRDNTAPVVSIQTPFIGQYFSNPTIVLSVSGGGDAPLWWQIDGGAWEQGIGATISKIFTLTDGFYSNSATAQDRAGNISGTATVTYCVDTQPPLPFVISANVVGWTNNNQPTITFGTTDATSGVDRYEYSLDGGQWALVQSPYQLAPLGEGLHVVSVRVFDKAGNIQTAHIDFQIDTVPPEQPLRLRAVPGTTQIEFRWANEDDAGGFQSFLVEREPAWTDGIRRVDSQSFGNHATVDSGLELESVYSYRVWAIDRATNLSTKSGWVRAQVGLEEVLVNRSEETVARYKDMDLAIPVGSLAPDIISVQLIEIPLDDLIDKPHNPLVSPIFQVRVTRDNNGVITESNHADLSDYATISITYDPALLPEGYDEGHLKPFYYDDLWGRWMPILGGYIDTTLKTVNFKTNHFTDFSVQATIESEVSAQQLRDVRFSPFGTATGQAPIRVSDEYGSVSTEFTELVLPGKSDFDLVLKRTYDTVTAQKDTVPSTGTPAPPANPLSGLTTIDPNRDGDSPWYMGYGWRLNFPAMNFRANGIWIKDADGQVASYSQARDVSQTRDGDKRIVSMINHEGSDSILELTFVATEHYQARGKQKNKLTYFASTYLASTSYAFDKAVLIQKDGSHVVFGKNGRVTSISDASHLNFIRFSYDSDQQTTITDSMNRVVRFTYEDKRIKTITVSAPGDAQTLSASYTYNGGNLVSAIDVGSRVWSYGYGGASLATKSKLLNPPGGGIRQPTITTNNTSVLRSVSGPGFGISEIQYQTRLLQYVDTVPFLTNRFPGQTQNYDFGVDLDRLFPSRVTTKTDSTHVARTSSYQYNLAFGGFAQFHVTDSTVEDGRIAKYTTFSKVINPRNVLSTAPEALRLGLALDVGPRSDTSEIRAVPATTTFRTRDGDLFETQTQSWDTDNFRLIQSKSTKTDTNYAQVNYSYDAWANVIQQTEESRVGTRLSKTTTRASFYGTTSPLLGVAVEAGLDTSGALNFYPKNLLKEYSKDIYDYRTGSPVITNEKGAYKYSVLGQLVESRKWTGTAWARNTYEYTPDFGDISFESSPTGQVTRYAYDYSPASEYRITTTEEAVQQAPGEGSARDIVSSSGYRRLTGTNTWTLDPKRFVTERTYDKLNRILSIVEPSETDVVPTDFPNHPVFRNNNAITQVVYNDDLLTSTVTNPVGLVTVYDFDTLGRLGSIAKTNAILSELQIQAGKTGPETVTTTLAYDGFDQVSEVAGPISNFDSTGRNLQSVKTSFGYDLRGRVISVHAAGAIGSTSISYNDATNESTSTDEMGRQSKQVVDWNNNVQSLTNVVAGQDIVSHMFYDGAGRQVATIDPNLNLSMQTYSPQGLVVSSKKPARSVLIGSAPQVVTPEIVSEYDAAGYLKKTTQVLDDGTSRIVNFLVNGLGQTLQSTVQVTVDGAPKTIITKYVYDSNGNKTAEKSGYVGTPLTTKSWTYDYAGRVLSETDEELHTIRYTYDKVGNRTLVVDPRKSLYPANPATFELGLTYNKLNRLIKADLPAIDKNQSPLPTLLFDYDGSGNLLHRKRSDGQSSKNTYTLRNQVATETLTDGTTSYTKQYTYDDSGLETSVRSPSGRTDYTEYDEAGRIVRQGNNVVGWNQNAYDPNGNVVQSKDGKNNTTTYGYDADNQMVSMIDAKNNSSAISYDRWGQKVRTTDRENNVRTYRYDEIGRLTSETTPWNASLSYVYDAWGSVVKHIDARGTQFVREFTDTHRLKIETATNGNKSEVVSHAYDEAGDLKSSTNNGVAILYNSPGGVYTPNPYGLTTAVKRTVGAQVLTTGFQYDQHLQLTGVASPDTAVSYGYNALGQLKTMPGWVNGNVAYDAFGRFTGFTLANNVQKSVSYNDQDQLIGLKYSTASGPDLKSYAFTYDQASNVIGKKIDAHASNSYSYDALNQLIGANEKGWFQQKPESLDVAYSAVDRDYVGTKVMDFTVSPVLSTSTLKLDMASRSVGVDLKAVYGVNKIELHPQSTTHRVKKADITVYASTSNLSPTDYQKITGWTFVQSADGSLVLSFPTIFQARYIKINTIWDDRDVANKTVDRAQFFNTAAELVKVWALTTSQDQAFTYDKNGNRTELSIDAKPQGYTYYRTPDNTGNLSWVRSDGQWYYQYDQAGNTIVKAKALVTTANVEGPDTSKEYWTYDWDLHNRLSSVKKNGQQVVSYVYDTLNYRVQRTGTDGTTIYTYGRNGALLYQKNLATGLTRTLAYLSDTIIGWTETVGGVTTRYYANTDELGSVTQVVSSNASNPTVLWQSEYTAFGVLAGAEGSMSFAGMFTGKDIDPDTGLTYHWNRWRSEDGSRFWSEDPARDGANWYGYAGNSPLVFTDPTGLVKVGQGSGGGGAKNGAKDGAKSGASSGSGSASGNSKSGSQKNSTKAGSVSNGTPRAPKATTKPASRTTTDRNESLPRGWSWHDTGTTTPTTNAQSIYKAKRDNFGDGSQSQPGPSDGQSPESSGQPTILHTATAVATAVVTVAIKTIFHLDSGKSDRPEPTARVFEPNMDPGAMYDDGFLFEIFGITGIIKAVLKSALKQGVKAASKVPTKFTDVLNTIKSTGKAPDGFKGGSTFANDGRAGGQVLPKTDAAGNPVTYKEWDVNPFQKGVNRGTERVVTGSDGRAYYTTDHYTTFNPLD